MQKDFNSIKFLTSGFDKDELLSQHPLNPFADETIDYLNSLSSVLNKDPEVRDYPEVLTFAFFCRKANLLTLKKKFLKENTYKLGRGIVFHIAPSNVPVNFAYSLVCGMLAGNINIVRVPSREFRQINLISRAININNKQEFSHYSKRIVLVSYDKNSSATSYFSSFCDVRIIWGGDDTIDEVRKNKLLPRSFDITFSDRYSFCIINADKFANESRPETMIGGFYNDTYLSDQNACTSPHLIIWIGTEHNIAISQKNFWSKLHSLVKSKYTLRPITAIDKLTVAYCQAISLGNIKKIETSDNFLWRMKLSELDMNLNNLRCNSGYFTEYHAKSIYEVSGIIDRKYQTLSYYGFEKSELADFIKKIKPLGIDRIVPIGRTLDFSLYWDGYNLIESLSREVEILN